MKMPAMFAATMAIAVIWLTASARPQNQPNQWFNGFGAIQLIGTHMKNNRVAGLAVAIARNGRLVYSEGFGWKNREANVQASDYTRFRLAAVSEPVTSLLLMELVRKKQIELDSPARRYIPELPRGHSYSVRNLLAHTSGISGASPVNAHYDRMSEACKTIMRKDLSFSPGKSFLPALEGYAVLGWLIENAGDKPYSEYAQERFRAWGLTDMGPENAARTVFNRSEIYHADGRILKPAKREDLSGTLPAAGLESSARDLTLLGVKLLAGDIIDRRYMDSIAWKSQTAGTKNTGFGLGWKIVNYKGRRLFGRSSSMAGASAHWWIYPDHGIVISLLANTKHQYAEELVRMLGDVALNTTANVPGRPFN